MICEPCRDDDHFGCPEVARQVSGLSEVELAASHLCTCQHKERGHALERTPTKGTTHVRSS